MFKDFIVEKTKNLQEGYKPLKRHFSIGYFGAQARFSDNIIELIHPEATRYIDLTAGGCGTPYKVALTKNIPITTNDFGYYSNQCATSVFKEDVSKINIKEYLLEMLDIEPVEGYLTSLLNSGWKKTKQGSWSKEMRMYIDGYCIANKDKPLALAALGKSFLGVYSFRGMSWVSTTNSKEKIETLSATHLINNIIKKFMEFYHYNLALPQGLDHNTSWNDANSFIHTYDKFEGSHVYMDPAWPWNFASNDNPYFLSSELIPQILLQRNIEVRPGLFWEYGQQDRILKEVTDWVEIPLSKGAKRVIVNTQSTNYPEPSIVEAHLKTKFNKVLSSQHDFNTNLAKDKKFGEYFWIIES